MATKLLGLVTQNWILGLGYSADQIDWLLDWANRMGWMLGYSTWLIGLATGLDTVPISSSHSVHEKSKL
jgi:hypothetical protein|uniref:Uncharacterized protein n=1 Tax=Picea glauca TaxID=3330 RepID=A0A101LVB7_PICGL|nr:hypothetical protein ABT39_MTgene2118 [Picea glauca]QHR86916.1 hypothetical protein Q903MT_gene923 [Picea sitchensis]